MLWELLKDPDRPTPLALDPNFATIDRTFEVEGAATEVQPGESLRVLMVIARPLLDGRRRGPRPAPGG